MKSIENNKDEKQNKGNSKGNSEGNSKGNNKDIVKVNAFEAAMKEYLQQGREKLIKDLTGTREAIKQIANDKTKNFMLVTDKGLNKEERDYLKEIIISSMYQTFCYGYGIGKIEGKTNNRIFL